MSPTGALLVTSIFAGEVSSRACSGAFIATALIREIHFGRSACILRKIFFSIVFYRIEPTIRYTLAMFSANFHGFQGIVGQVHQLYAPRYGKTRILAWRLLGCF